MKFHKRKLINFRFAFVLLLAILVITALLIGVFSSMLSKIILLAVVAAAFVIFLIFSIILKKKALIVVAIILAFALVPTTNIIIRQNSNSKNLAFNNSEVLISGRICENYSYTSSGNIRITLDSLSLSSSEEHKEVGGKILIYVRPHNLEVQKIVVGKHIDVLCEPEFFSYDGDNASYLSNGIIGRSYANFYNIDFSENESLSLKEKLKFGTYNKLKSWNVKYADVAYAMLFGDSDFINKDTLNIFRNTGVAHLLAVSGLHVSLIAMLISFILKKLKVSPYANLITISLLLLLYAYLCDFSVSVVRASLMTSFALLCKARGKPYDRLSVLCLVATFIILINPLKLINISFILSFSAVLSIILTVLPLKRFFSKFLYEKLANSLALIVGVQIGLIAVQLVSFGTYPVLSIFSNLISVPLESFAFMLLVPGTIISLVFPFMSFIPKLFGLITSIVVRFNGFIAGLGLIINFESLGFVSVIFIFLILFIISDFVFIKKNHKLICAASLLALGALTQVLLLL